MLDSQSNGEELPNAARYHEATDSQVYEATVGNKRPRLALDAQSRFSACETLCAPSQSKWKPGSQDIVKIHDMLTMSANRIGPGETESLKGIYQSTKDLGLVGGETYDNEKGEGRCAQLAESFGEDFSSEDGFCQDQ